MISFITLNRLFPFSAIMDDYGFYYLFDLVVCRSIIMI